MDPMEYFVHSHRRHASHSDAAYGPSSSSNWMPSNHSSPPSQSNWQIHAPAGLPPSPLYDIHRHVHYQNYSQQQQQQQQQQPRLRQNLDPLQSGHHIGLPPLPMSFEGRGYSQFDPFMGTPLTSRHWDHIPPPSGAPSGSAMPNQLAAGSNRDTSFGSIIHGTRGLAFQTSDASGVTPPSASPGFDSQSRSLLSTSASPGGNLTQQGSSQFSIPPPSFPFTPPRRTSHHQVSSPSLSTTATVTTPQTPRSDHRPARSVHYHPVTTGLPSPSSERQRPRHSRARRSITSRHTMSDPAGPEVGESSSRNTGNTTSESGRRSSLSMNSPLADQVTVRQIQMARGAVSSKLVASKMTLRSLQSVSINDLPDNERTCVICYNDYGVETPEGVNEAPLRLPKCKHIFGDHCIKKWLEDSDSCPYCRDKLPSEPKHQTSAARVFMNMMRMRGVPMPPGMSAEVYLRFAENTMGPLGEGNEAEIPARPPQASGRRPAPSDASEAQRRTRARRNHQISRAPMTPSSDNRGSASSITLPLTPNDAFSGDTVVRSSHTIPRSSPAQRRAYAPSLVYRSEEAESRRSGRGLPNLVHNHYPPTSRTDEAAAIDTYEQNGGGMSRSREQVSSGEDHAEVNTASERSRPW